MITNKKKLRLLGNQGINISIIVISFLFSISLYFFDYHFFYSKYTNFESFRDFGDLFLLLKGIDFYREGLNPFLLDYDPPYNYPSSWSFLKYFHFINKENTEVIAICLILISLLLINELIKKQYHFFLVYVLALISPVSILLFERGNSDIIILILALITGLLFYKRIIPVIIIIFIALALKLYPIVWFSVLLFFISKKNIIFYLVTTLVFLTFFLYANQNEIMLINKNTPFDLSNFTYGIKVLLLRFQNLSLKKQIVEILLLITIIPLSLYLYRKKYIINKLEYSKYVFLFTIGVSTIFVTSLLTVSWDYRLFFLFLCFPFLIDNKRYFLIILILLLFWYQTFKMYFFYSTFLIDLKQILLLCIVLNLSYILINIIFLEIKNRKLNIQNNT